MVELYHIIDNDCVKEEHKHLKPKCTSHVFVRGHRINKRRAHTYKHKIHKIHCFSTTTCIVPFHNRPNNNITKLRYQNLMIQGQLET
jgi:hypothetical protein